MSNYANKIRHLYPNATDKDFKLIADGLGVRFAFWNRAKLGTQPMFASLDSQVSDAVANDSARAREAQEALKGKRNRMLFEINYNQENRIRVAEGLGTLSRPEYKDVLIALYKTL